MGHFVAQLPLHCCALSLVLPLSVLAQTPNDISALKELAESTPAPKLAEVEPQPPVTNEPDFRHRLLLNPIPGLPGEVKFLAPVPEGTTVRALFTLDGKLLALPLKRDKKTGDYRASFPTPFRSLDYQFQLAAPQGSAISLAFRARPNCDQEIAGKERFTGEHELIRNIRLLRNDAALLSAAIQQVEIILGK